MTDRIPPGRRRAAVIRTAARVALAGLLAAAVIGCGRRLPRTVRLEGTVTLDGQALSNAFVTFYPADKDGASPVTAPVTDGRYSAPAVPQGRYRVAFRSSDAPEGYGQPSGPVDSGYAAPKTRGGKKDPIPEKYRQPSLPADATADNLNLDFKLTSK